MKDREQSATSNLQKEHPFTFFALQTITFLESIERCRIMLVALERKNSCLFLHWSIWSERSIHLWMYNAQVSKTTQIETKIDELSKSEETLYVKIARQNTFQFNCNRESGGWVLPENELLFACVPAKGSGRATAIRLPPFLCVSTARERWQQLVKRAGRADWSVHLWLFHAHLTEDKESIKVAGSTLQ